MATKPFKVQAAAHLLATTVDTVRRMVDEAGINVTRQAAGTRTRLFSVENIFELAHYRANRRGKTTKKKRAIATIYAPKAGVGKTTLASNYATLFALKGLRTLVIDLDFQAKLTLDFGYDPGLTLEEVTAATTGSSHSRYVEYHFGNLVPNYPTGRMTLQEVIKKPYGEHGPHLIPADINLDRLDTMLAYEALEDRNADLILAKLLKEGLAKKDRHFDVSEYDVILFDAPPARNRITSGALLASDYLISPVSMEGHSTKALSYLSTVLTEMHDQFKRTPELITVCNFFDPHRVRIMGQLLAAAQMHRDSWLDASIRHSEDFSNGPTGASGVPLVLAKPNSQSMAELRESADAVLNRMGFD